MKKLIFVILALLLTIGIANATNIPVETDPKNYPTVWMEQVYNGSGSDIPTGRVVVWDFSTSDSDANTVYDDMCPWVKISATAHSVWTAGVTTIAAQSGSAAILNGSTGRIIIKGPAVVHNNYTIPTKDLIYSTTSSGYVGAYSPAADTAFLGVCIAGSATINDVEAEIGQASSLIYVNPTLNDQ